MLKLFSMFVRYAHLPEAQFVQVASQQIFKLANIAEKQSVK